MRPVAGVACPEFERRIVELHVVPIGQLLVQRDRQVHVEFVRREVQVQLRGAGQVGHMAQRVADQDQRVALAEGLLDQAGGGVQSASVRSASFTTWVTGSLWALRRGASR